MKLKDLVLIDGKIINYKLNGKQLVLEFCDYSGNLINFIFNNVYKLEENGSIKCPISNSKIYLKENKKIFEIYDDEEDIVLKIIYSNSEVKYI